MNEKQKIQLSKSNAENLPLNVTARQAELALKEKANPEKAAFFPRFFKTGMGEYGEGDQFIGVVGIG